MRISTAFRPPNDQDHRAGGRTLVKLEKPKSSSEANSAENPNT
jgi:hypothetical protein